MMACTADVYESIEMFTERNDALLSTLFSSRAHHYHSLISREMTVAISDQEVVSSNPDDTRQTVGFSFE